MREAQQKVAEFQEAAEQEVTIDLQWKLIREEAQEVFLAIQGGDPWEIGKELSDLLYVTLGAGNALGIDLEIMFNAVHDSNMSKIPFEVRDDGKILKGPNYVPPTPKMGWLREIE